MGFAPAGWTELRARYHHRLAERPKKTSAINSAPLTIWASPEDEAQTRYLLIRRYSDLAAALTELSDSGSGTARPSSGERQRFDTSSSRINVISFGRRS